MTEITVVAMVADKTTITLYLDDGTYMVLNSNEYRTQEIVEKIMPFISNHKKARVNIEDYQFYSKFEKKTGGLVRFFRMAKSAVSSIFGSDPEPKKENTKRVETETSPPVTAPVPAPRMTAAQVEQTGSKVIPATLQQDETIVAVIGTGEKARAIPHMEQLQFQFANSITGSHIGMVRFLERIATVIDKRGHSIEDMLKFLEKADLPIADDGSVIAYKVLNKRNDHYVDCHSKLVIQKIGSHVFMDPNMVDPSRRNDCSHGLHIARRDYLSGFGGDVIVLCKINPEDFIAVPHYSPSKVRVSGYHILFELPKEVKDTLRSNKAMTTNDVAAKMLGAAIAGDHIGIIQTVEIRGNLGTNLVVTDLTPDGLPRTVPDHTTAKEAKALPTEKEEALPSQGLSPKELHQKAEDLRKQEKVAKPVDPASAAPVAPPVKASKPADAGPTKADQFKALHAKWAKTGTTADWDKMMAFKKQAKKSLSALGLEPHQVQAVEKHLNSLK